MLKSLKVQLFASLLLVGALSTSCEKQEISKQTDALQTEQAAQVTTDNIVSVMASDPLVKQFIAANEAFLNEYDKWYDALSVQEKKAYRVAMREAMNNGTVLQETFRTKETVSEHHQGQEKKALEIKEKYSLLYKMSNDEQENVKRAVYGAIMSTTKSLSEPTQSKVDCHGGYNACSWSCYDNHGGSTCYDACRAGYTACTGG